MDQGPANLDLEGGTLGRVPSGWFLPDPCRDGGYSVQLSEDHPKQGKRCAVLSREVGKGPDSVYGNLMQSFDATPYRGRRIRFQAAVRVEGAEPVARAQLWLRVDRKNGQTGLFDNMGNRPIANPKWCDYQIVGDVAEDAESIALGLILIGDGKVWLDAASFEVLGKIGEGNEPLRALKGRGLDNLVAYARLLGYVRYFHPSDQAANTNWDQFAIEGVPAVEGAKDADALARTLESLFHPIAPSVQVFATEAVRHC
jgi:hypothetical protein